MLKIKKVKQLNDMLRKEMLLVNALTDTISELMTELTDKDTKIEELQNMLVFERNHVLDLQDECSLLDEQMNQQSKPVTEITLHKLNEWAAKSGINPYKATIRLDGEHVSSSALNYWENNKV